MGGQKKAEPGECCSPDRPFSLHHHKALSALARFLRFARHRQSKVYGITTFVGPLLRCGLRNSVHIVTSSTTAHDAFLSLIKYCGWYTTAKLGLPRQGQPLSSMLPSDA